MIYTVALVLLASLMVGMAVERTIALLLKHALRKAVERPRHAPSGTVELDAGRVHRALAEAHAKSLEQHTEDAP